MDASPSTEAKAKIAHAERRIAKLRKNDFGLGSHADLHEAERTLQSARELAGQERYVDAIVAAELAESQMSIAAREAVDRVMAGVMVA